MARKAIRDLLTESKKNRKKYGKTNKVVTKTKEDGVKTKEKSYTYKSRPHEGYTPHNAEVTIKKMINRKAKPGEIKKSISFRGEVENPDDADNPKIHTYEINKYKRGKKYKFRSYMKKTPEIYLDDYKL